jgi:two-component system, sporulation sensor kinase E
MEKPRKQVSAEIAVPRPFFNPSDFAVFDQVDEAIFVYHPHTGVIVTLNQKACELYGYSADDGRRYNIVALQPGEYPFTAEEALRRFKETAAGNPQAFEWKTRNKVGREFWIEVFLRAINIGDHEFLLAIIRDVSRRKLAEQRLLLKQSYLELMQETALAVLGCQTPAGLTATLLERASVMFGPAQGFIYLADEAEKLSLQAAATADRLLARVVAKGAGPVGKAWERGEPVVVENYRADDDSPTGDYIRTIAAFPLQAGASLGVIGLYSLAEEHRFREDELALFGRFADLAAVAMTNVNKVNEIKKELAARKEQNNSLERSEERYRQLFNSTNDAIYIARILADAVPGLIVEANDTACAKLGYSREELFELTPADIVPLEYRGDMQEKIELLYVQKYLLTESAHLTKDGTVLPVEINSHLVYWEGDPYMVTIARDITDRKRIEKELARLDRLNLIGAMAAGIGHEIRNPLTTVRGFLQMMAGKKEFSDHRNYLDLMVQELDRANSIVTEFLSLAKNKAVDLREVNLNTIINILLPLLEAGAILYNKTVKTELAELPNLPLDEKEIRQLVINLVRNGLDAMPPGGTLTIKTAATEDEIILSVHDQGKGIPPDLADKVGTPFFSTKEYGVGLGLAVCYSIAARHNARITFDSTATGTIFLVHFNLHVY